MRAGDLRHRVTIQQQVGKGKDPVTKETRETWQDVATVWAAVEPLRGREYFQAMETESEAVTRVRIRYRPGVTNEMRVQYGDRILYIQGVIDVDERHRELQLMCVENDPAGPGE